MYTMYLLLLSFLCVCLFPLSLSLSTASWQSHVLHGFSTTHIMSQSITPAASVLNLRVTFHEIFNFKQRILKTCCCCFYHIHDLCCIRRFISLSIAKTIATALVSSRLDNCNSLLYNTANKYIAKPQRVQKQGSHTFSSFFSLTAATKIIALAPCGLSHYFQDLYNSLSNTIVYTIRCHLHQEIPVSSTQPVVTLFTFLG